MPANCTGARVFTLQGAYRGLGHLFSPGAQRGPYAMMPYALDNGRFPCWSNGADWSEDAYLDLLDWAATAPASPLWALVPDHVSDPVATLAEWPVWAERIRDEYGFTLAVAVQDGMTEDDVRRLDPSPAVIFVGGTTTWKRATLRSWCSAFSRVHVGRINTKHWLWECYRAGAESCDGTGWLRGDTKQLGDLIDYLRETEHFRPPLRIDWRQLKPQEELPWVG